MAFTVDERQKLAEAVVRTREISYKVVVIFRHWEYEGSIEPVMEEIPIYDPTEEKIKRDIEAAVERRRKLWSDIAAYLVFDPKGELIDSNIKPRK